MQVQIKQLALESENVYDGEIDRLLGRIELAELDLLEEAPQIGIESLAGTLAQKAALSVVWHGLGPKGYFSIERILEDYTDLFKSLTAWLALNQSQTKTLRAKIKSLRSQVNNVETIRGGGLLTYLGDSVHHVTNLKTLLTTLRGDLLDTEKYLTIPAIKTARRAHNLTEFICDKDNDFTWGWEEATAGCRRMIEAGIIDHTQFGKKDQVANHTAKELQMPEGSEFSPLLLGNYASATNWSERYEEAKHLPTPNAALKIYAYGLHDLVSVPKHANKYALSEGATRQELFEVLDIAEEYLNQATDIDDIISEVGLVNIKTIMMSNWLSELIAHGVKTKDNGPWITPKLYQLGKIVGSRSYRRIYLLMRCCVNWSMKLQRKSATRNREMAKQLISFVESNVK